MRFASFGGKLTKQKGFTLVEFAMVMLLSGLVLAALIHGYKVYLTDKYVRDVYEKQKTLSSSFSVYFSARGRYPCPADPTLADNDPQAGIEGIAGADPDRCLNLLNALPADGDCTGPGGTGICRVAGLRSTDGPGPGNTNPDPIFIGAIPYKSLKSGMETDRVCYRFSDGEVVTCNAADPTQYNPTDASMESASRADTLDPWNFQMTYAVTASQTFQALFDSNFGAIRIQTEGAVPLLDPPDSAHFVIISHGENHIGAYNKEGQIPFPCGSVVADDNENCDLDSVFTSGLRRLGQGPTYFDDVILYRAYTLTELWKFNTDNASEVKMYNNNSGNVGIGVTDPEVKLHVAGDALSASVNAEMICDNNPASPNCWSAAKLGGTGMKCPPPDATNFYIPRGIKFGDVWDCVAVPKPTGFEGDRCPPGEFMKGFTDGGIICGPMVFN